MTICKLLRDLPLCRKIGSPTSAGFELMVTTLIRGSSAITPCHGNNPLPTLDKTLLGLIVTIKARNTHSDLCETRAQWLIEI